MQGGEKFCRRWLPVGLACALLGGALAAVTAAPAGAQLPANSTALPGAAAQQLVDPATSHVFVALPTLGKIAVLDFDGAIVRYISGEPGAESMALVGSHVYVASPSADTIDEIDTSTFTRTRTLASGIGIDGNIVAAGGALWVNASGGLTRVALTDGSTTAYGGEYGQLLAGDAADANTLFAYAGGIDGSVLNRFDLSTDPPTVAASLDMRSTPIGTIEDLAVTPDNVHVIVANRNPEFFELNLSDLTSTSTAFPAGSKTNAVAITPAAGGLLVGGMYGDDVADVAVYRLSDPSGAIATHDFGDNHLETSSVAVSPDGARVFVVTGDSVGTSVFHVLAISGPPPPVVTISISPNGVQYSDQRVGTYGQPVTFTIRSTGNHAVTLDDISLSGTDPNDFFGDTSCFPAGHPRSLAAGTSCEVTLYFSPLRPGERYAKLVVTDNAPNSPAPFDLSGDGTEGYFLADARGQVGGWGDAVFRGDVAADHLAAPVISIAATANGDGYWLLARDGGIFSFGNAAFYGSTGAIHLNKPVVGMTPTRTGRGYWLVASDGGIFSFGDARFYGSTGAIHLNQPIVGMAATPTGHGYWLVASDGGIFSFGDARFYGSTGAIHLNQPIVSMMTTPAGHGYQLVARDGGIFRYGDAEYHGSGARWDETFVGAASAPDGHGYWLATSNGMVGGFGTAEQLGDAEDVGLTDVVGVAATSPLLPPELLGEAAPGARPGRLGSSAVGQRSATTPHSLGGSSRLRDARLTS